LGFAAAAEVKPSPESMRWQAPDEVRAQFNGIAGMLESGGKAGVCAAVTSAVPGEGVTWVTAMLACAVADSGGRVLVIDAGGKPRMRDLFQTTEGEPLPPRPSLSEFALFSTEFPGLSIASPRPGTVLSPGMWVEAISSLRTLAPVVLIDCDSVGESPQIFHFSASIDGALFVVEAERERRDTIAGILGTVRQAGIRLFGVILNKRRLYVPSVIHKYL
jgi:Mrp family chromosome partitioning ATPase